MKRSGEMSGLFLLNKFGQSGKKSGWKPQNCLTLRGFRVIYILPKTKGVLIYMVIAGTINRVAFYCRVNHRDRDYEKYLDDVMRRLEEEYGKQKWDLQIFFEEASGADPDRKEFNRLKAEIAAKKIDVVVTMRAATIARNWGQFMEFMLICSKKNVDVVCIDKVEDAQAIFRRIQKFQKRFFEGSDVTCV